MQNNLFISEFCFFKYFKKSILMEWIEIISKIRFHLFKTCEPFSCHIFTCLKFIRNCWKHDQQEILEILQFQTTLFFANIFARDFCSHDSVHTLLK